MTGVTGASLTVFQPDGWWWVVKCDIYDVSRLGEGQRLHALQIIAGWLQPNVISV